jgi:hypothetical protein
MPDSRQAHQAASKLSQLLADTIVNAAPHTSKLDHEEKWRQTEAWLERLESHTQGQVAPFLEHVLANSEPPTFIRHLLEEAIDPPEQFSAVLEQIFLYGIVSNIIGTSVNPFLQAVSNDLTTAAVKSGIARPTDPATIATAAGRGLNLGDAPTVTVPAWAYTQAAMSGISEDDVNLMASLVGLPPAFQQLLEMKRRGIINADELAQGLREGDFRDDWIDRAVQLIDGWPTPTDFVRAAVQAQMSYDDAKTWANNTGLDTSTALPLQTGGTEATPDMFGLLFAVAGRPPGPEELARAANRGIINWDGTGADALTFQQGIAESDVKTKWTDILQQLAVYVPPPRTVGTLLEHGAITSDQAVAYWNAGGVPEGLAKGYAYMAQQEHIGQDKLLAIGEVKSGYYDGIFDKTEATSLLGDLGIVGDVASETLAIIDFRREIQAINAVVRRISTLYAANKLTATNAKQALTTVGIPDDQATAILGTWEALREQPIRVPTAEQIGKAVQYDTLTQAQALAELASLGYQDRDAAIVLSATSETKVTPLPAAGSTITG